MAVERTAPEALALILADTILRDCGSSKFFIQGTYSNIFSPVFPGSFAITAYAAITSGHGETDIEFRLVSAEDLHIDEARNPLASRGLKINFPDPLLVMELAISFGAVSFPQPGEYRLQLFGNGVPLKERRLQVIPTTPNH